MQVNSSNGSLQQRFFARTNARVLPLSMKLNSKWNFTAHNVCGYARLSDLDAVPPEGFSFFYQQRDKKLMISGNIQTITE